MSRFYVGQRVRLVKPNRRHDLAGLETVVVAIGVPAYDRATGNPFLGIEIDMLDERGLHFACYEWQLEPATDCYDKTEWSECVWKPEHLRVGA